MVGPEVAVGSRWSEAGAGGDRLLARLQDLESSHRKQQEQLLREQLRQREMIGRREHAVGFRLSSPEMAPNLEDRSNPSGSSDPSGSGDDEKHRKRATSGVGPQTKPKPPPRSKFDENAAVSGVAVPFQHLVDQKLKEDAGGKSANVRQRPPQPRKFLKRGEGLKRFGEKFAESHWKPRNSEDVVKPTGNAVVARPATREVVVEKPKSSPNRILPRKPRESTESDVKERKELRAFEMLEEAAQDSSFCSTASFIERLLVRQEKAAQGEKNLSDVDENEVSEFSSRSMTSSSPLPPEALHEEWQSCRARVMRDLDDYLRTFDWVRGEVPNLSYDVRTAVGFDSQNETRSPERNRLHPHVRFNEMVQKLTFPSDSRVEESSVNCDSESSEADTDSDVESKNEGVLVAETEEEVTRRPEPTKTKKPTPRRAGQVTGRFRPTFRSKFPRSKVKPKSNSQKVAKPPRKPEPEPEPEQKAEHFDLVAKAEQLNREMGIFRRENERVLALRRQLDAEKRKLQAAREKFTQEAVEQSKLAQKRLREEEDKLKRDRMAFEKFRREQKASGDAKLAEENRLLKLQLQDMEAELKDKDAKFGSAQSRYKMSLRKLENTVDELKLTISRLEVENGKLKKQVAQAKNSKEPNPAQKLTRQIHDVNDLISKTFFKNPGTNPRRSAPPVVEHVDKVEVQPLRGLLKKSQSEPAQFEAPKSAKTRPLKENPHESKLREESRRAEERLFEVSDVDDAESDVFLSKTTSEVQKEKTNKFPRVIATKESVEDLSKSSSGARTERRSGDGRDKDVEVPASNVSQISQVSQVSEASSTDGALKFFESERVLEDGTIERTLADGRKESVYPNGNRKVVSPGGKCMKIVYYNGDVQEVFEDGTVEYFFAESRTWHTTKPDGSEVIELPSGEVQVRKPDGEVEVTNAEGLKVVQKPNGTKIAWQPNGTRVETKPHGERTIFFPNGEQEVQTADYKKRVYVDGTEKIMYNDGRQETRYSNGRLRIRDSRGNLVVDCFA